MTLLVLLTTLVGFYLGTVGATNYLLMLHAVLGTGLLASGAAALNQLLERDFAARMRRTQSRPLPSGRLSPEIVLLFGGFCSVGGLVYLALAVNLLDPTESSLAVADSLRIGGDAVQGSGGRQGPRELWPWCIIAALVLLTIEWLINAWSQRV